MEREEKEELLKEFCKRCNAFKYKLITYYHFSVTEANGVEPKSLIEPFLDNNLNVEETYNKLFNKNVS